MQQSSGQNRRQDHREANAGSSYAPISNAEPKLFSLIAADAIIPPNVSSTIAIYDAISGGKLQPISVHVTSASLGHPSSDALDI